MAWLLPSRFCSTNFCLQKGHPIDIAFFWWYQNIFPAEPTMHKNDIVSSCDERAIPGQNSSLWLKAHLFRWEGVFESLQDIFVLSPVVPIPYGFENVEVSNFSSCSEPSPTIETYRSDDKITEFFANSILGRTICCIASKIASSISFCTEPMISSNFRLSLSVRLRSKLWVFRTFLW